ncbi:hypothetical protein [Hydrogenimonas thermophila]|uniref:Uncharacterized protein n=1 Tax=Hydrogenimonas thermophila TaxID=223786 RepID=A0A1I5RFL7_9BACT|nr:hypothetical protein [Hydrogenimonas thermophila]SFP57368.1 hypothetical protein SAMN05216234_12646 [Hydrogenimonas thermophila]
MRLFLLFFIVVTVFAFESMVQEKVVTLEAKLFPKIVKIDLNYKKKLIDGKILMALVYDTKKNEKLAEIFKKAIENSNDSEIEIVLLPLDKISKNFTAYVLFLNPYNVKHFLKKEQNDKLVFAYDSFLLSKGAMISLDIGEKVKPIINIHALKRSGIKINPLFVKLSKVYSDEY